MNRLAFGLPEVRRWAEFSSDFNPIHFDPEQARNAGLDDLVVHGMLALLPVKQEVSRAHAANGAAGQDGQSRWMKFHALFRNPIPHGSASQLTLRPSRGNGLAFQMSAEGTAQERFRGSYTPAAELGGWLQKRAFAPKNFVRLRAESAERFAASYPDVREGWIMLDAIVFSEFMRCQLDGIAQQVQGELARVMGGDRVHGLFVQASHTVYVDTQALCSPGPLPFSCDELSYATGVPDVVVNSDKLIGSVSLPVMRGQTLVMLLEIGLLAKPVARPSTQTQQDMP